MSRIGLLPILLPSGTDCSFGEDLVSIKGPKGSLEFSIFPGFFLEKEENVLRVHVKNPEKPYPIKVSMLYGTLCRTIANMVIGVSVGFEKTLELVGVGYKADLQAGKDGAKILKLSLGYSHDILYPVPSDITIVMEKATLFKIQGINKQRVGQITAEIIRFRPPEPYKGKGIRIPGQYLRIKEGKK
jgi:large subunit ribosomal protein L6